MAPVTLLIWFEEQFEGKSRFLGTGDQCRPVSELREFFDLEELRSFTDGVLYRCIMTPANISPLRLSRE